MKLLEVHSVEGNMIVNAIINLDVCLTLEKNAFFYGVNDKYKLWWGQVI